MSRPASGAALVLSALTALFLARVAGQALVACFGVAWLPPMEAWYSGLLPYPILLPVQIVILAVQVTIDRAVWKNGDLGARPRAAARLRWFAYAYALAMMIRYAITRSHAIPVLFHLVLAGYIFTVARVLSSRSPGPVVPAARAQAP